MSKVKELMQKTSIPKAIKFISTAFAAVFLLIIFFSAFYTINTGEIGLLTRFGAVTGDVKQPGLHWKIPFINGIEKIDTRVQKDSAQITAASKDLQTVCQDRTNYFPFLNNVNIASSVSKS